MCVCACEDVLCVVCSVCRRWRRVQRVRVGLWSAVEEGARWCGCVECVATECGAS